MLTRGLYIGEIIDEFASLGEQIRMRNRAKLYDLTLCAETFFRDVLNALWQADYENLNAENANTPGLDLGSEKLGIGVQVTSSAGATKVNHTLEQITDEHARLYHRIVILVAGRRQSSYAIDPALASKYHFEADRDIWDLDTLVQRAVMLTIEQLTALHSLVRANIARVKMDLEIPDDAGNYPTSGYALWEVQEFKPPGTGDAFIAFERSDTTKCFSAQDEAHIREDVQRLSGALARLPRVTREFFAALIEHREPDNKKRKRSSRFLYAVYEKVERWYRGDLQGELRILEDAGLVSIDAEDPREWGAVEIHIHLGRGIFEGDFTEFLDRMKLDPRKVIGNGDLSSF